MTIRYHIIANLHSGSGKGRKIALDVHRILDKQEIPFTFYQTEYRKHTITLIQTIARQLKQDERILIIGGDGTLHEAVTGLIQANLKIPVAYLPAGTGNDFARSIGMGSHYKTVLKAILKADHPTLIECFIYRDEEKDVKGIGLNSLGMGFDGKIIQILNDKHTKKTILSAVGLEKLIYLKSISSAFKDRKTFDISVTVDGETYTDSDILIVGAMNHPYFGGGIKIDPESQSNNHELAVMMIKNMAFPELVKLLTKVLTTGSHIHSEHFRRISGKEIAIQVMATAPTQVDGESLAEDDYHFNFELASFLLWQ